MSCRRLAGWLAGIIVLLAITRGHPAAAAEAELWEFRLDGKSLFGKPAAHDSATCLLLERDGRMHAIDLARVESFQKTKTPFKRFSPHETRTRLRKEFGSDYEVTITENFAVVAPRGKAAACSSLFEQTFREFRLYFSSRNFQLPKADFLLIAVVLPNEAAFHRYCERDGVRPTRGLAGYYLPVSNRVAMFEPDSRKEQEKLRNTIIHEATHQIAFNRGLHSRFGQNPKWTVEGLATVFEAPGIRGGNSSAGDLRTRINPDRLIWFKNFARERRKTGSLREFIRSDAAFESATLDAYSQAWALSFYLVERRSWDYSRYLKRIAARNPLAPYSADEREADFRRCFGNDLTRVEADFLEFLRELK